MDEIDLPEEWKSRLLAAWKNTPEDRSFLRSFAQAMSWATHQPLEVPTPSYPLGPDLTPKYREFVSYVGWLAVIEHPGTFPLPPQKLAALFGHSGVAAIELFIGVATDEGLLKKVNQQTPGEEPQYRFDIGAFPILKTRL
jgi:hypothetical protein